MTVNCHPPHPTGEVNDLHNVHQFLQSRRAIVWQGIVVVVDAGGHDLLWIVREPTCLQALPTVGVFPWCLQVDHTHNSGSR